MMKLPTLSRATVAQAIRPERTVPARIDPGVIRRFLDTTATAFALDAPVQKPLRARTKRTAASGTAARSKFTPPKSTALAIATTLLGLTLAAPAAAIAGRNNYPLIVTPVQSGSEQDEEFGQIRVGIFDTAGQRLLHAQVHGRTRLGALPAGEYTVEVSSAAGSSIHQVKLGPGERGIVRYGRLQA